MSKDNITDSYLKERNDFGYGKLDYTEFQFIESNKSSYSEYSEPNKQVIRYTFDCDDDFFQTYEKPFIKKILTVILNIQSERALMVDGYLDYMPYIGAFYASQILKCGDVKISIIPEDGKLVSYIKEIVDSYNENLLNGKCKRIGEYNGRVNNGKIS